MIVYLVMEHDGEAAYIKGARQDEARAERLAAYLTERAHRSGWVYSEYYVRPLKVR